MANLPTVKQLRYLVELQEVLHFRKAADACFVTQSAFSSAIKELESNLNAPLVDRSNRSVVFTEIGNRVADRARSILADLHGITEVASDASQPFGGTLNLGVIPTIAPFVIARIVAAIAEAYPDLDLGITENKTVVIHRQLLDGELDLLLVALPYDLVNAESIAIFEDPFRLSYFGETKLIDRRNGNPDEIADEAVLLLDDGHCMREHVLQACGRKSRARTGRFSADNLFSLVRMVDADIGVTLLPQLAIDAGILHGTQVDTTELDRDVHRKIGLAWRKASGRIEEYRQIAGIVKQCLGK